jgi:hypothetical protein
MSMSEEQAETGFIQRMIEKRNEWAEQQPSLSAELKAMAREGIKDVRSTVNETFLGSPELGGEPGTPLNPTPQMVTQDMGTVYGNYSQMLDSYAAKAPEQEEQQEKETER